jgi:hypothetical protein
VALYYGVKWILSSMDPSKKKKDTAKQQSGSVFKRLGIKNLDLNEYVLSTQASFVRLLTLEAISVDQQI